MFAWKGSLGLAVCAALAAAGYVRGNDTASSQLVPNQLSLSQPTYLDDATTAPAPAPAAAPTPPQPLMYVLEQVGIGKTLEDLKINIYGWVEGGWTYASPLPPGNVITGPVFNTKNERIVLDQLDANVERDVDKAASAKAGTFDIGFRCEAMYGWDAGAIHSNGLLDDYSSRTSPENQFDVVQAYVDVAIPVGTGLQLRVGKFVTLLGQEVIEAGSSTGTPANAFYSHSYLFTYAIPLTQTGVLGMYQVTDKLAVQAGITRGWNQSINDNNGAIDFLGQAAYTVSDKTTVTLNVSFGPEAAADNHDYWTVLDFILAQKISDQITVTVNADYGDAPHSGPSGSDQWYGAAGYVAWVLNPYVTLNGRGEWYHDSNGFTLGTPFGLNVYEATAGAWITPFPNNTIAKNLVIRPEFRYDYADRGYFDGGTSHTQLMASIDAIFSF